MSMSDDEVTQLLRKALRLRKRPPVTDEEVEALLSAPPAPPGTAERVRARFVEKAFLERNPEPARFREGGISPFGDLIAGMRKDALVTLREASAVLNQEPPFLSRLENGDVLPWLVDAEEVAGLLKLYRLHMDAVESSISIILESRLPFKPPPPRVDRRGDFSEAFMEDRFGGGRPELRPEVVKWLADLRKALERLDATDLLN